MTALNVWNYTRFLSTLVSIRKSRKQRRLRRWCDERANGGKVHPGKASVDLQTNDVDLTQDVVVTLGVLR